ncbi:elongation factor P maturation arginine rhamnosyltransferase EarP [Methylibium sp.]|uniref:elongation factor P maturation arginine rhamnosyltransferase EarP n=1 Tax=Methylibium sp. TaxID=2067992 RepID=UPI003D0AF883
MQTGEALHWDVFCHVVDNHGDLGVCWRLARRLAALGQQVRLWVDDASALAWMAPNGARGVRVLPWREPTADERPGEVVVETFGCDPPIGFVERMAGAPRAPVWINLEYLSAEAYAARSHAMRSPQLQGPAAGLDKWFFYPGFTPATGGLLREDGLAEERERFEPAAWLATLGIAAAPADRLLSLFCYQQPALAHCLTRWQTMPTQLLVTPGPAARQVAALLACSGEPGSSVRQGALQVHFLPWLTQDDYDRLLWSCDLNHVRGEDSLVRALWAARPFVWQLYPQHDGAHQAKLDAFLGVYLQGAPPALVQALRSRFHQWNGVPNGRADAPADEPDRAAWRLHAQTRCGAMEDAATRDGDLASRLYRFAISTG